MVSYNANNLFAIGHRGFQFTCMVIQNLIFDTCHTSNCLRLLVSSPCELNSPYLVVAC